MKEMKFLRMMTEIRAHAPVLEARQWKRNGTIKMMIEMNDKIGRRMALKVGLALSKCSLETAVLTMLVLLRTTMYLCHGEGGAALSCRSIGCVSVEVDDDEVE